MSDQQMVLPTDTVMFQSQEVAAVVAESRYAAADGVAAGTLFGLAGAVERLIHEYRRSLGDQSILVVLNPAAQPAEISLPAGLMVNSATFGASGVCTPAGLTLTCALGDLPAPPASLMVTLKVTLPRSAPDSYPFTASLTSSILDPQDDNPYTFDLFVEPRAFTFLPLLMK